MEQEVSLNISARHVHLTQEALDKLFASELHVRNYLNQVGQYATEETVTIKTQKGVIENVRIIGPVRAYNQVEISKSDARKLGIEPPVRRSGDLDGSEYITIIGPKGEVSGNFCIIADRHVHLSPSDSVKYGIKDGEKVELEIKGVKHGVIDVNAKVSDDGYFEVHLDTDDANAFLITPGDIGILKK